MIQDSDRLLGIINLCFRFMMVGISFKMATTRRVPQFIWYFTNELVPLYDRFLKKYARTDRRVESRMNASNRNID